jgi:5-methylcytosine-specific restriction endonuclease McrA
VARPDDYTAYLRSPEWNARRRAALKRAGFKCSRCPSTTRLHVHHKSYERLGEELPRDLLVLCDQCHRKEHGIAA